MPTNRDIDEFESKVNNVHSTIQDLLSGKVDPLNVDIEFDDDEELLSEEFKKKQKQQLQEKKLQECSSWWEIARNHKEIQVANNKIGDCDDDKTKAYECLLKKSSYEYYDKWDKWIPSDPVTLEEDELKSKKDREEFEKNNPDFCQQFLKDLEERTKKDKEKQEKSDKFRLTGNNFYKEEHFKDAIKQFMEGLKLTPFDTKLTFNIAQAYIRMNEYEDALEFISRTLFLDSQHVKALSRKGHILSIGGDYENALEAVNNAMIILKQPMQVSSSKMNENKKEKNSSVSNISETQYNELLAQQNEYQQRVFEKHRELELTHLLSNSAISDNVTNITRSEINLINQKTDSEDLSSTTICHASDSNNFASANKTQDTIHINNNSNLIGNMLETNINEFNQLLVLLRQQYQSVQEPSNREKSIDNDKFIVTKTNIDDMVVKLLTQCSFRIYIRTNGILQNNLLPLIETIHLEINNMIKKNSFSNIACSLYETLSYSYQLLAACLNKEFSSKQLFFNYVPTSTSLTLNDSKQQTKMKNSQTVMSKGLLVQNMFNIVKYALESNNDVNMLSDVLFSFIQLYCVCTIDEYPYNITQENSMVSQQSTLIATNQSITSSISSVYQPLCDLFYDNISLLLILIHYCELSTNNIANIIQQSQSQSSTSNTSFLSIYVNIINIIHSILQNTYGISKMKSCLSLKIELKQSSSSTNSVNSTASIITNAINTNTTFITSLIKMAYQIILLASTQSPTCKITYDKYIEKLLGIFLTISMWDEVRQSTSTNYFLTSTNDHQKNSYLDNNTYENNLITIIFMCMKNLPQHTVNCLAILINTVATSGNNGSNEIKNEIVKLQGHEIALKSLFDVVNNNIENKNFTNNINDIDVHSRYMSLLSRLVSIASVSDKLKQSNNYEFLCQRLLQCTQYIYSNDNETKNYNQTLKWIVEEQCSLITILASVYSVTNNTKLNFESIKKSISNYELIDCLLSVFPTPKTELGEVTPNSVSLQALATDISPLLLGNAACCLLNLADHSEFTKEIFLSTSKYHFTNNHKNNTDQVPNKLSKFPVTVTVSSVMNIDKMICGMATCTEMRVRKNISILIAKGCKHSQDVKERMVYLKGMEMIRALNS